MDDNLNEIGYNPKKTKHYLQVYPNLNTAKQTPAGNPKRKYLQPVSMIELKTPAATRIDIYSLLQHKQKAHHNKDSHRLMNEKNSVQNTRMSGSTLSLAESKSEM